MKKHLITILAAGALWSARGTLFTYSGASYGIPDGNPNGVSSAINVSGMGQIADITVSVNVSGGYDGDIYAYLSYNGSMVTLLNRIDVGSGNAFGSSASGFVLTLGSTGSDVHWASAGDLLSGNTFLADGRQISPFSTPGSFDAAGTATLDGTFGGLDPNGTWTLFFADVSGGGGTATLNSWSLNITPVPEPVNLALAGFAVVGCGLWFYQRRRVANAH